MPQRSSTARAKLVAAITEEILNNPEQASYPIASEHQLCRRFKISRVTVRLALSDLENRGLIYRRHGKGTFAHGRSTRVYKNLGVLLKTPQSTEHRPIAEIVRGAQIALMTVRASVVLISMPPEAWRPEAASSLGGVIVFPQDVTTKDLAILDDRKLPYLLMGETLLPGPRILLGQREAARNMTERLLAAGHRQFALLSGFDACLDAPKRLGVHDALRAAGFEIEKIPEFSAHDQQGDIFEAAQKVLRLKPRPTAVITFDDSLGSILSFLARRQMDIRVPDDLSIVSFHDWPYLNYIEPALCTAQFDFFNAGQRGAEALNRAALTGQPVEELSFAPTYRLGQTVGPVPKTV